MVQSHDSKAMASESNKAVQGSRRCNFNIKDILELDEATSLGNSNEEYEDCPPCISSSSGSGRTDRDSSPPAVADSSCQPDDQSRRGGAVTTSGSKFPAVLYLHMTYQRSNPTFYRFPSFFHRSNLSASSDALYCRLLLTNGG